MTKINDLINEKCPNGVEYKSIESVFVVLTGMTGVSKKWAENGNCRFIDYMNVYKNRKVNVNLLPYATVKSNNQTILEKGDILLTSASELPEECAISSVIEDSIEDGIFLDDHLLGLRLKEEYKQAINTTFINYYLESKQFRENLYKAVRGVTRFYISNKNFVKLVIPIPPIEIQTEIVRVLDKFLELEMQLKDELEKRKEQQKFWCYKLYQNKNIEYKFLNEISKNCDSKRKPITKGKRKSGEYPYYGASGIVDYVDGYIFEGNYLLISEDGANLIARSTPIAFSIEGKNWVNNHAHVLKFENTFMQKYVEYYLNLIDLKEYITGAAQPKLNQDNLNKIPIPIPSEPEQKKIVNILNKFDKLINDDEEGLYAEIELRKKQYEYYRNKLLSFKEVIN